MPKRFLRDYLNDKAKASKRSKLVAKPSRPSNNLKEEIESSEENDAVQHMRFLKSDQNNEIKRLLLHNSKKLECHVDHYCFPAFNVGLRPQESNEKLINYPSYAFSAPYPVFVGNCQFEQTDLCFRRPLAYDLYKRNLRFKRGLYQSAWKANKELKTAAKNGIYHSSVFDFAKRAFLHPDPFFSGSYDYYFSGGNLCTLTNSNVIHAGGEKLRDMMVSTFAVNGDCADTYSLANLTTHTTSEDDEILEISPLLTSLDCSRQNCFIARQRNLISFNYLNGKNEIKTVTRFRTKSTPFISFAQSERDINTFIITTMKQHIRLYDLNSTAPALVKLFEISPKTPSISWNTTKPWRENTFLYANEKQFFLIDVRTSPDQWMNSVNSTVDTMRCDHISAIRPSEFNNLFYVATNHKLQCMDVRYLKKSSFSDKQGVVCQWSHQLLYAPLMIDSFRNYQTEYIALSSALPGDLHICQLNRERNTEKSDVDSTENAHKNVYYSPCLPYQPPTLMEVYQNARLAGKCLNPEANLETRIKRCTTGMSFFKFSECDTQSSAGFLLTSNSNGDIFAQPLSKREPNASEHRCNDENNEKMAEYEQKIWKQNEPPLNYTEIKNLRSLRKVFLCKNLSSITKYDFDVIDNDLNEDETPANNGHGTPANPINVTPKRNKKRLRLGRWQKPLSTLYSYKDALVPDLLSIWDIDIEEEKHINLGNLHLNLKTDPEVKVKDWLETNMNSNHPMLTIPSQEIAKYNGNNASNLFDSFNNVTSTQNTSVDFANAVHSTQITMENSFNISNTAESTAVGKLKAKRKTKKYVKGF